MLFIPREATTRDSISGEEGAWSWTGDRVRIRSVDVYICVEVSYRVTRLDTLSGSRGTSRGRGDVGTTCGNDNEIMVLYTQHNILTLREYLSRIAATTLPLLRPVSILSIVPGNDGVDGSGLTSPLGMLSTPNSPSSAYCSMDWEWLGFLKSGPADETLNC